MFRDFSFRRFLAGCFDLFQLLHQARFRREEDIKARAFRLLQHAFGDGLRRIALYFQPAVVANRRACAREQQSQIIIDFGLRADRRTRIARGIFLADRNGGANAYDFIYVRLFHSFEELPRVGRERFDVAALPFGIDRVERQRAFAGAADACDDG